MIFLFSNKILQTSCWILWYSSQLFTSPFSFPWTNLLFSIILSYYLNFLFTFRSSTSCLEVVTFFYLHFSYIWFLIHLSDNFVRFNHCGTPFFKFFWICSTLFFISLPFHFCFHVLKSSTTFIFNFIFYYFFFINLLSFFFKKILKFSSKSYWNLSLYKFISHFLRFIYHYLFFFLSF